MAVAALSTSAIALATTPAAVPASSNGEAPEAFAKLVSGAKPDGHAAQGGATPQLAEGEAEAGDVTGEIGAPGAEAADAETAVAAPVDLAAELQALFAFAGQIAAPVVAPPSAPIASSSEAARAMPEAQPAAPAAPATLSMPATTLPGVIAAAVPAKSEGAQPASLVATETAEIGDQPPISDPAAAPVAADSATTVLRRDISAIVASLKAAFHPTEAAVEAQGTAAAPAGVVLPFAQPSAASAPTRTGAAAQQPAGPLGAPQAAPIADLLASVRQSITAKAQRPAETAAALPANERAALAPAPAPAEPAASAAQPLSAPAEVAADPTFETIGTAPAPAPAAAPAIVAPAAAANGTEAPAGDVAAATEAPNQIDQTVTRHLDLARDTQWLDQLARDISRSVTHQNHIKFQLNPEHLGALTVEIANSAAGTAIKLSAETDQARAIIADAQPRLLAEVRAQGVRVAESHVDLNQQQQQQQGGGSSASAQSQHQQQQRQASEDSKPFARTQAVNRDDAGDSASRDDGELYA